MKPEPHYYDVLELPPFASAGEVKAAYRRLARQHHPDLNQNDRLASEERLKRINQAYDALKDPTRKATYDETLRRRVHEPAVPVSPPPPVAKTAPPPSHTQAKATSPPKSSPPPKPASSAAAKPTQPSKPLFNWLFDSWQTGTVNPPPSPSAEPAKKTPDTLTPLVKGPALESPLMLTAAEADSGCTKSVPLTIKTGCSQCAATGRLNGQVCRQCGGARTVTTTRLLEVKIPAGAKAGAKIKVAGEGYPSPDGAAGSAGDLILTVQLPPNPQLVVKGLNVYLDWPVSVPVAILGGVVQVPTVHGEGALTIPAGSQPGQVLRLKEQGVHQGAMKGDQFVTVQIPLPLTLSPKARKLYEQLRQLEGE